MLTGCYAVGPTGVLNDNYCLNKVIGRSETGGEHMSREKWSWDGVRSLTEQKPITMALWSSAEDEPVLSIFNGDLFIPKAEHRWMIALSPMMRSEIDACSRILKVLKNNLMAHLPDGEARAEVMAMLAHRIESCDTLTRAIDGDDGAQAAIMD
jgi:hypothetical protein